MKQKLLLMLIAVLLAITPTHAQNAKEAILDHIKALDSETSAMHVDRYEYATMHEKLDRALALLTEMVDGCHSALRPTSPYYIAALQRLYCCKFAKDICPISCPQTYFIPDSMPVVNEDFAYYIPVGVMLAPDKAYALLEAAFVWEDLLKWEDITKEEYEWFCYNYTSSYGSRTGNMSLYKNTYSESNSVDEEREDEDEDEDEPRETFADSREHAPHAYMDICRAHATILRKTGDSRYADAGWEYVQLLITDEYRYRPSHEGEPHPSHLIDTAVVWCDRLLTECPDKPQSEKYSHRHILNAICRMTAYGYQPDTKEALHALYAEAMKANDMIHADDLLCLQTDGELLNKNYKEALQVQMKCYKERLKSKNKRDEEEWNPMQADYMELWRTAVIAKDKKTISMCEQLMQKEYGNMELDYIGYTRIGARYPLSYRWPLDVLFEEQFTQQYDQSPWIFTARKQHYDKEIDCSSMWEGAEEWELEGEEEYEDE